MADYDNWDQPCCGGFPGCEPWCKNHINYKHYKAQKDYATKWRAQGLVYNDTTGWLICRRGCGTVVHDPEAHVKNVCPKFEPVAGDYADGHTYDRT